MSFTKVLAKSELPEGTAKTVKLAGHQVAVFNVKGKVYALADTCVHMGGPVGEGTLEGTIVACPWHGWRFDVRTGDCQKERGMRQRTYAVKLEGEDILLSVEKS